MFFEHGMRGGVCYIHKRYSEASKNKHILYLDTNNLYECTMKQYLPTSNFLSGSKTFIKSNKN